MSSARDTRHLIARVLVAAVKNFHSITLAKNSYHLECPSRATFLCPLLRRTVADWSFYKKNVPTSILKLREKLREKYALTVSYLLAPAFISPIY